MRRNGFCEGFFLLPLSCWIVNKYATNDPIVVSIGFRRGKSELVDSRGHLSLYLFIEATLCVLGKRVFVWVWGVIHLIRIGVPPECGQVQARRKENLDLLMTLHLFRSDPCISLLNTKWQKVEFVVVVHSLCAVVLFLFTEKLI